MNSRLIVTPPDDRRTCGISYCNVAEKVGFLAFHPKLQNTSKAQEPKGQGLRRSKREIKRWRALGLSQARLQNSLSAVLADDHGVVPLVRLEGKLLLGLDELGSEL